MDKLGSRAHSNRDSDLVHVCMSRNLIRVLSTAEKRRLDQLRAGNCIYRSGRSFGAATGRIMRRWSDSD